MGGGGLAGSYGLGGMRAGVTQGMHPGLAPWQAGLENTHQHQAGCRELGTGDHVPAFQGGFYSRAGKWHKVIYRDFPGT